MWGYRKTGKAVWATRRPFSGVTGPCMSSKKRLDRFSVFSPFRHSGLAQSAPESQMELRECRIVVRDVVPLCDGPGPCAWEREIARQRGARFCVLPGQGGL